MDPNPNQNNARLAALLEAFLTISDLALRKNDLSSWGRLREYEVTALFDFSPQWFTPLLETARGLRVLAKFFEQFPCINTVFKARLEPEHLLRLCFTLQSTIMADPQGTECFIWLIFALQRPLFHAIQTFIHPDKSNELSQLRASLPTPPTPLPHFDLSPSTLALVFPNIDTTKFAPQFDWFIYLLTQYSPTDESQYCLNLETSLNEMADPSSLLALKPGHSLDEAFIHNQLLNSYEEYLLYKLPQVPQQALPQVPPQIQQPLPSNEPSSNPASSQPQQPPTIPTPNSHAPILFPYFPNQHPLRNTAQPAELSSLLSNPTDVFMNYYLYMFILGPSIHTTTGITAFVPNDDDHPFLPLRSQLYIYHYRAWYSTTSRPSITQMSPPIPPTTTTAAETITHHQPLPDFTTNPYALLQLTILPVCSTNMNFALQPSDVSFQRLKTVLPKLLFPSLSFYRLIVYIISHCFPDQATHNALLEEVTSLIASEDLSEPDLQVSLSHTLYQYGHVTIHQHNYRRFYSQLQDPNNPCRDYDPLVCSFLESPFVLHNSWHWDYLAQHITLCVHAGFLSPFPLPPLPPNPPSSLTAPDSNQRHHNSPTGYPDLYHSLITFRALLHASLVRLTGLILYFPQSTRLLASAVSVAATSTGYQSSQVTLGDFRPSFDIPFLPPHSIPDPRDAIPNLQCALVDDEGKLYAVKYGSSPIGEQKKAVKVKAADLTLTTSALDDLDSWGSRFPPQGAPRHRSLFHHAAIEDLRTCISWHPSQPESQAQVPADDWAWIKSADNVDIMKTPDAHALQQKVTAYYKQVREVETQMVIAQMQKVLVKADQARLFDIPNAARKRQHPPTPSSHPTAQPLERVGSYPMPEFLISFVLDKRAPIHDTTFTKQRGVLYPGHPSRPGSNLVYDHNYCGILTTGLSGIASLLDAIRQRSEWALELLIVGSLGLHAPLPAQLQSTLPAPFPTTSLPSPDPNDSLPSIYSARLQYCKDVIISRHLPTLLGALQPTPRADESTPQSDPQSRAKLTSYHDTLTHITLLTTLPLYETFLSLPCSP